MWPNRTKPGTSRKTCFWVNSHKRWLAQNYFQIFKFVFSCLLSGNNVSFQMSWKNLLKWDVFQTINYGLSLLTPIHSCTKWKTNWPIIVISKKCSEAKICKCHLTKSAISWEMFMLWTWSWCHFKAQLKVVHLILKSWKMSRMALIPGFVRAGHICGPVPKTWSKRWCNVDRRVMMACPSQSGTKFNWLLPIPLRNNSCKQWQIPLLILIQQIMKRNLHLAMFTAMFIKFKKWKKETTTFSGWC